VKEFFGKSDAIIKVNLPKYQDTGRCLGYGHIEFDKKKDYEAGLAKDGQNIGGR
jgi:RNA recognition motif-containing protein